MASLELEGPWDLDDQMVDREITRTSPGNYALGYEQEDGTFIVLYVGRSDDDLNDRLHDWTGKTKYKSFKASSASSPTAAYEKECHNYHDFGGSEKLYNDNHPDKPAGINVTCPVCGT